jgi:hypothetical protein
MRRGVLTIVASTVALLLVGEVAARALDDNLPAPLRYHSLEAQVKVERMDQLADAGGVDIAVVGTSIAYDVDPSMFPPRADGSPSAYNAALGSAVPALSAPWALDVVIPRLHPKVLLLGIGSFDVKANSGADLFADAFLESAGGRRDTDSQGVLDRASWWLDEHSALWEHRTELRDPENVVDAVRGQDPEVDDRIASTTQPTGRPSFGQDRSFEERILPGGGDVSNWTLGLDGVVHIQRLIRDARPHGVEVVLVNMPVTQDYIDRHPKGAEDYETYLGFMGAFAAEEGVTLLDFHEISDHQYFADEVHLNLIGAQLFTGQLIAALQERDLLD